ncbi:MAG: hypothetical protein H8E03_00285 [Pelagibacteraceae bacterium]|nr:hypothetical protein [Pelagibacteraceae bacterium]
MKYPIPEYKYIITEKDIMDILIAYNNQDYEWVLNFFESLTPANIIVEDSKETFTYEQLLANAELQ